MSKKKDTPRPLPDTLGLPPTGADSHAHLDSEGIIERLPEVMGRGRGTGLASIGQVFLGPAAYHANKGTFAGYPGVFFLMGIHPCDGQECTGATLKAMREAFAEDPRLRAVGEIGLDFYWKDRPSSRRKPSASSSPSPRKRIVLWSSIRATRQRTPCGFWKPKVSQDAPCCGTASAATPWLFLIVSLPTAGTFPSPAP